MTPIKLFAILVALACFIVGATVLKGTGYEMYAFGAGVGLLGWIAPEGGKKKAAKVGIIGIVLLLASGCTATQRAQAADIARSILDIAKGLCEVAGQQETGLSLADAREKFCSTREQLEPWIGEAKAAMRAGAVKSGMVSK
jgi:hypothetical protein